MPLKSPDFEAVRTFLTVFSGICVCGFILELVLPDINQWYLALLNAIIFGIIAGVASYLIKSADFYFWMNLAASFPIFWILGGVLIGIESVSIFYCEIQIQHFIWKVLTPNMTYFGGNSISTWNLRVPREKIFFLKNGSLWVSKLSELRAEFNFLSFSSQKMMAHENYEKLKK